MIYPHFLFILKETFYLSSIIKVIHKSVCWYLLNYFIHLYMNHIIPQTKLFKSIFFVCISFVITLAVTLSIYTFTQAEGPISIDSCSELQLIGNDEEYPLDGDYILGQNIDCSISATWNVNSDEWTGGADEDGPIGDLVPDYLDGVINNGYFGFNPIGDSTNPFTGTFDGGGNTISNLWIFRKNNTGTGLFGVVNGGTIQNLNIHNSKIVGGADTGSIAGSGDTMTISNVTITSSMVRAYLQYHGGGLVGIVLQSIIEDSSFAGNVHGSGNVIGGLVGLMEDSTITNSSVNANVDGGERIGGVVGEMIGGNIGNTDVLGTVTADRVESYKYGTNAGGFVGYMRNGAEITGSTSAATVRGIQRVGGFVGHIEDSATITNSTASGNVYGLFDVGGFIGSSEGDGETPAEDDIRIENSSASGDVYLNELYSEEDDSYEWFGGFIGRNKNSSWIESSFATGNVNSNQVDNDLEIVGGFSGANGGVIINSYATGNVYGEDQVGGFTGRTGNRIEDSYATGNVYGDDEVGGFIGENDGRIYRSYATGNVYGDTESSEGVGGFSGKNRELIEESYATGNVIGYEIVGGFTGANGGDIKDSYARGSVTGQSQVGGFAGRMGGAATNTYATGVVTGVEDVGGYLGYDSNGAEITNSYWDTQTSGQTQSDGGAGRTTAQMKSLSNYPQVENQEPYSLQNVSGAQSYQYLIWYINEAKGGDIDGVQVSELTLYLNGEPVSWPTGTDITNPDGENNGGANEFPTSLIDNDTENKWLDYAFDENGYSYVIIDMGEQVTFDSYSFVTGNDVPGRDPSTWQLLGSNSYETIGELGVWSEDWVVLDTREGEIVTDSRNTYVHLSSSGWDFENIWTILANKNNGYPILRWSTLPNTPVDSTTPTRRRSSGSGSIPNFRNQVLTQTPTQLPTSIEGLQALLLQLQTQLAQLLANTPASNTNPITRDLQLNDEGGDVRTLQQFLISKGYTIPAGATGFFGPQTRQALIKFQQDNNITPAQGYFGPRTRAQIQGL
jgi:hypothetical protein